MMPPLFWISPPRIPTPGLECVPEAATTPAATGLAKQFRMGIIEFQEYNLNAREHPRLNSGMLRDRQR